MDPTGVPVYTGAVGGDFDGDMLADVCVMEDGSPLFLFAPSIFESPLSSNQLANDMAVWRDAGKDSLLIVNAQGLVKLTWDGTYAPPFWQVVFMADSTWEGAKLVRVESGNPQRIYGVMSDGKTFRRHSDPSPLFTANIPQDVEDFLLVDLDGDGGAEPEIAAMTANGLYVFDLPSNGQPSASYPIGIMTSAAMTKVGQAGTAQEWLVYVATHSAGVWQYMATVSDTGMSAPEQLEGDPGVVALRSADRDGDGDDDLFFSIRSVEALGLMRNLGDSSGPVFSQDMEGEPPDAELLPLRCGEDPPDALNNQATPCLLDLDNDGDVDYVSAVQATSELSVLLSNEVKHEPLTPHIDAASVTIARPEGALEEGEFKFFVKKPDLDPGAALGATDIQVLVWYRPTPDDPLVPSPWLREDDVSLVSGDTVGFKMPTPEVGPYLYDSILFCLTRSVQRDGNGDVIAVYPGQGYGAYVNVDGSPQEEFITAGFNTETFDVVAEESGSGQPGPGPQGGGGEGSSGGGRDGGGPPGGG